jgi:hypothetical protein
LFHKEVPTSGNSNTPNVSKFAMQDAIENGRFKSNHAANLKMIVAHADEPENEVNLYSIDTGDGMNLW